MYAHLTARTRGGAIPLADPEKARWLWRRLRCAFPDALAAVLMPNHPHLVIRNESGAQRRLAAVLGAFARTFELGELWQPVPPPELLETADKVSRNVRYAALNPCRDWHHFGHSIQLARDPLEWLWSTHRDVMGATIDPWVDADRLARSLGWRLDGFRERFHRYVSSDPHVRVDGTPPPQAANASELPRGIIDDVERAVLAAMRESPDAIRRRGPARTAFIGLAYRHGWRFPTWLAKRCRMSAKGAVRLAGQCPARWVDAAALCLGDSRLVVAQDSLPRVTLTAERGVVAS
jgi:hypothetical protein